MAPAIPSDEELRASDYIILTSLVLVSWELFIHLFQDVAYLRSKQWWKRPVIWAYFFQRYGAFTVLACQATIRFSRPPSCYAAGMIALAVGGIIVLPSVSLIYLYRVLAIWNWRLLMKRCLVFLWVILLGASITAPFSQEARNMEDGRCAITRREEYTMASFIANAIFDAFVLFLIIANLVRNRRDYRYVRSPLRAILLHDGILYFAVSVTTGITDMVFLQAAASPVTGSIVIPLHIALTSVMATRLVNSVFQLVPIGSAVDIIDGSLRETMVGEEGAAESRLRFRGQGVIASGILTPHGSMAPGSGVSASTFDPTTASTASHQSRLFISSQVEAEPSPRLPDHAYVPST